MIISAPPLYSPTLNQNAFNRVYDPQWGTSRTDPTGLQQKIVYDPTSVRSAVGRGKSAASIQNMPLTEAQREAYTEFANSLEATVGRIGEYRNGYVSAWLLQMLSSLGSAWEQYYEQMLCDPIVESNLHLRATAVISDDWEWVAGVPKEHPLFDLAEEVKDFVKYNFDALGMDAMRQPQGVGNMGFERLLYQVSRVTDVGYRVTECTYKLPQRTGDRWAKLSNVGVQLLNTVEVKEHWATPLITDRRKRVLGIMDRSLWVGLQPPLLTYDQYGQLIAGVYWLGHPSLTAWTLKYVVHSWAPVDNDPRGNPLMRQIFASWWARQIVENQKLRFSEEAVFPVLWGTTPQGAVKICLADGTEIDPVEEMGRVIAQGLSVGNRVFTFPWDSKLQQLPPSAAAAELVAIGHTFESNIRSVALGSPLQTGTAQFQTQGTTSTQSNWANIMLRQQQIWLQNEIRQYAYRIVVMNYGKIVDQLDIPLIVPRLRLKNVRSRAEFLQSAQGAKHLADAGLIANEAQANAVYDMIDFPFVEKHKPIHVMQDELERDKIAAQQEAQAAQLKAQKEAATQAANQPAPAQGGNKDE